MTFPRSRALFIATSAANYRPRQSKQMEANALHLPLSGSSRLPRHYFCGSSHTSTKTSQTALALRCWAVLPLQQGFRWGPQGVWTGGLGPCAAWGNVRGCSCQHRFGHFPVDRACWDGATHRPGTGSPSSPRGTQCDPSQPRQGSFPTGRGLYPL